MLWWNGRRACARELQREKPARKRRIEQTTARLPQTRKATVSSKRRRSVSKNAPLQDRHDEPGRSRRPGVEFEWPQLAIRIFGREQRRDEINLERKLVGVVADESFPRVDRGRRKRFATLHLTAFSIFFWRVVSGTTSVGRRFGDLSRSRCSDRAVIRSGEPSRNREKRYGKASDETKIH